MAWSYNEFSCMPWYTFICSFILQKKILALFISLPIYTSLKKMCETNMRNSFICLFWRAGFKIMNKFFITTKILRSRLISETKQVFTLFLTLFSSSQSCQKLNFPYNRYSIEETSAYSVYTKSVLYKIIICILVLKIDRGYIIVQIFNCNACRLDRNDGFYWRLWNHFTHL